MELQEIDVYIEKDGSVRLEVRGVKGGGCLAITAPLEQALGNQIESREMTAESYESAEENVYDQQWQHGG